jgi:serine phosphatase RsbU (regulator of sigma subunit)
MKLPDDCTLITLADVTGHGIGPALIVAACRAYIRAAAMGEQIALASALAHVNNLLHDDTPSNRFVTAAVAVLDPTSSELAMISAGQAPLLFHHHAEDKTESWYADQVPLALIKGIEFGSPRRVKFEPGDMLVLTTDGFFEWANAAGEPFGMDRLKAFVSANAHLKPQAFIKALHAAVIEHAAGTPQPDDLTIVVVRRGMPSG